MGTGLPAGPGAASGQIYFTAEAAVAAAAKGQKVILTRQETSPEDLRGMIAAEGILTTRGGASSHAALVARQMGKICVCGAHNMGIDYVKKTLSGNGVTLKEGDSFRSMDSLATSTLARSTPRNLKSFKASSRTKRRLRRALLTRSSPNS